MCQGCEASISGKKSSLLRTSRRGLLRGSWEWKRISGGKPFVLKGIQHVGDARRAVEELGVDGIVVSNHAGRQVDGAIASLDALENIVEGMLPVFFVSFYSAGVVVL